MAPYFNKWVMDHIGPKVLQIGQRATMRIVYLAIKV